MNQSFTEDEWQLLRRLPTQVGQTMVTATDSGLTIIAQQWADRQMIAEAAYLYPEKRADYRPAGKRTERGGPGRRTDPAGRVPPSIIDSGAENRLGGRRRLQTVAVIDCLQGGL